MICFLQLFICIVLIMTSLGKLILLNSSSQVGEARFRAHEALQMLCRSQGAGDKAGCSGVVKACGGHTCLCCVITIVLVHEFRHIFLFRSLLFIGELPEAEGPVDKMSPFHDI